ncbi:MAG TPA: GlsB/YeaQ/YmgE family stress response membrane protein [Xanthobacteraceae bacterium]|nr:GlsB/YeaQ/YmgE family stress response membrane protein [Xanthobacteraceae bacterium]
MVGVESIIIMIIIGAIAGWLAGKLVQGFGFGLIWNIVIGIIGAVIGVALLTRLGVVPFAGFFGSIINATIGALVLLLIVGLVRRVMA